MTTSHLLLAGDNCNTPLSARDAGILRDTWDAHGYRPPDMPATRTGFNGEFQERPGVYLLGSYRAYNPVLMRFHNPDSLSPFGKGGLNAYAYCLGDPVKRVDPTGHSSWLTWAVLGMVPIAGAVVLGSIVAGMTTVSMKVAVAAGHGSALTGVGSTFAPEGTAKTALQWTSLALGAVTASSGSAPWGAEFRTSTVPSQTARGDSGHVQEEHGFQRYFAS